MIDRLLDAAVSLVSVAAIAFIIYVVGSSIIVTLAFGQMYYDRFIADHPPLWAYAQSRNAQPMCWSDLHKAIPRACHPND